MTAVTKYASKYDWASPRKSCTENTRRVYSADNPMEGFNAEKASPLGIRNLVPAEGEEEKMRESGREKENWARRY